jgi:hypothetical protein
VRKRHGLAEDGPVWLGLRFSSFSAVLFQLP